MHQTSLESLPDSLILIQLVYETEPTAFAITECPTITISNNKKIHLKSKMCIVFYFIPHIQTLIMESERIKMHVYAITTASTPLRFSILAFVFLKRTVIQYAVLGVATLQGRPHHPLPPFPRLTAARPSSARFAWQLRRKVLHICGKHIMELISHEVKHPVSAVAS